jgi:hypothetical protein
MEVTFIKGQRHGTDAREQRTGEGAIIHGMCGTSDEGRAGRLVCSIVPHASMCGGGPDGAAGVAGASAEHAGDTE